MTSRLLGIDHGDSRIGLAISDELGAFAHPYRTLQTTPKVIDEIRVIVEREQLSGIIIGLPKKYGRDVRRLRCQGQSVR